MENIPRNMEKNVVTFTPPEFSKRPKKRTFFVMESSGDLIPIRWIKPLIITLVFITVTATVAAGVLFFLYQNTLGENHELRSELDALKQKAQIKSSEKSEVIATRTPEPEQEIRTQTVEKESPQPDRAPDEAKPSVKPSSDRQASDKTGAEDSPTEVTEADAPESERTEAEPEVSETEPEASEAENLEPETVELEPETIEPEPPQMTETEDESPVESEDREEPASVQPAKSPPVAIEDFDVSYIRRRRILNVRFLIRNIGTDSDRASGHAIVVLKPDKRNQRRWLTLPPTDLISGRPSGEQEGESFSISNFRTMRFEAKGQRYPKRFKTATVFIFSEEGELVLEKDFPVEIE